MAKAKKKVTPKGKSKKGGPIRVDFTGVEGKRSTLPDDDYLVEIEAVEVKEGSEYPYFELTMVVQSGKFANQKLWDRMSTSPGALWRLRSFLEVIGLEVPDDEMEIDPDDFVGTQLVAVTAQEKYKNDDNEKKVAVRMVDFYSADDFKERDESDDDEDEEETKPKKSKAKKGKKKAKDDDDDDESDDDTDEDDEDETPAEKKKRLRKERRAARKAREAGDDDEDEAPKTKKKGKKSKDDDDDDEDEEEEVKPKKGKKKGKAKKYSADDINEMDEEGLEEVIEAAGLETDLSDFKTLRKKCAAVIDALEEEGLIEDDE